MNEEELINEINSMIAALAQYASVAVSLQKNIGKPVETLMKLLLSEIENRTLVNTNLFVANSKAIDLADMQNSIAFQITTNATRAKWQETDSTLTSNDMIGSGAGQYKEVRVIGFCKHSRPNANKPAPSYLRVEGLEYYLSKLSSLDLPQLSRIADGLRKSYNFSRLHPLSDEHCFGVFHRLINRDALRHAAHFEGSFEKQAQAFQDVKTMIFSGSSDSRRSKCIGEYYDQDYVTLLSEIDMQLSKMLIEIHKMRVAQSNTFTTPKGYKDFESARMETINLVNDFCLRKGLVHLPEIVPIK
ncbi:SMEK domain-containing protein [Pseudomonas viridiflava]|uniref:SMEK domain-containing protein n=1 Tax=Pseudomonas viridiflava TaxID=33069 RepID=UPI0013CEE2F3|nr:SMEK domain-containing protein [Pseudomonas viridiflava]